MSQASYFIGVSMGGGGDGAGGGDVNSVNGKKGNVIITSTDIKFNNTNGDLTSTTLQTVIDELNGLMQQNISDTSGLSTSITANTDKIENVRLQMLDCCGKVRLSAIDALGYLEDKIDKTTIQNIGGKLVAKSLDGLIASVNELNQTKGATGNIQAQIDGLTSMGNFTQSVPAENDLASVVNPNMNDIVIVLEDSTQGGASSSYMYNGTSFVYVGEFKVRMRDFTKDPIDLATEVVGKLPTTSIPDDVITTTDIPRDVANKIDKDVDGNLTFDGNQVVTDKEIDIDVVGKITEDVDGNMNYDGKPIVCGGGDGEHELIANEF